LKGLVVEVELAHGQNPGANCFYTLHIEQQRSWMSSGSGGMIRLPTGLILEHRVENNQELPSRSDQGNLLLFSLFQETMVEVFDLLVVLDAR